MTYSKHQLDATVVVRGMLVAPEAGFRDDAYFSVLPRSRLRGWARG